MATGGADASGVFLDPRHYMFAIICQLCEYRANSLQAMRAHFFCVSAAAWKADQCAVWALWKSHDVLANYGQTH